VDKRKEEGCKKKEWSRKAWLLPTINAVLSLSNSFFFLSSLSSSLFFINVIRIVHEHIDFYHHFTTPALATHYYQSNSINNMPTPVFFCFSIVGLFTELLSASCSLIDHSDV